MYGRDEVDQEVLRAEDIMPPYSGDTSSRKARGRKESAQKDVRLTVQAGSCGHSVGSLRGGTRRASSSGKAPSGRQGPGQSDIPKFDLAEAIMAEQRRRTSVRRKGPRKAAEQGQVREPAQGGDLLAGWEVPRSIEQQKVIAEIVTRDIAKLCGTDQEDRSDDG